MANSEHVYAIPDPEELAALRGAATPHFALQAHERISSYVAALPADDPDRAELVRELDRLEALARDGGLAPSSR